MDGAASPLSDLLEIQRLSPTMLRFRLRKVSYPYLAVNGFRLLCDTLVICYPDLLLDDLDPDRTSAWCFRTATLSASPAPRAADLA
ncbi:hypothetical protein P43SY_011106 [Pythium insidiosum]|uniref:Uncharacterized protein n=1 Tax=Pythium insidiosum TaxID=114742 RepID=A0AAD5L5F6_PYTIN|nr:hypothetical protein P43SY_011106 [Pythium insidiosum]KAJ0390977.1 hypothetical protein ATCC90586_011870 [Pythium insidiosum]